MRILRIGFTLLFVGIGGAVCCSPAPDSDTTGSGGSGGSGGDGGPAVPPYCADIATLFSPADCDACMHRECCGELAACAGAGEVAGSDASPVDHTLGTLCLECTFSSLNPPECIPVSELSSRLYKCGRYRCQPECYPPPPCVNGEHTPTGHEGDCNLAPEPDGAVTADECVKPKTAVMRGTISGKPIELTLAVGMAGIDQEHRPFSGYFVASGNTAIDLYWDAVCLYDDAPSVPVTGTAQLPIDDIVRGVRPCSQLWLTHDEATGEHTYRYNLLFDGGQITGCAKW